MQIGTTLIRLLLKKQSDLGLPCLSRLLRQLISVRNFRTFTIILVTCLCRMELSVMLAGRVHYSYKGFASKCYYMCIMLLKRAFINKRFDKSECTYNEGLR